MYDFLIKGGDFFQPAMLVYQRVTPFRSTWITPLRPGPPPPPDKGFGKVLTENLGMGGCYGWRQCWREGWWWWWWWWRRWSRRFIVTSPQKVVKSKGILPQKAFRLRIYKLPRWWCFCSWQSPWRPQSEDVSDVHLVCVCLVSWSNSRKPNLLLMFADFGCDFHQFTDSNSKIQRRTSAGHQLVAWACDIDVTPQAFFLRNQDDISYDYVDFQLDYLALSCFLNLTCNSYINGSYPCATESFWKQHFFWERWGGCLFY